MNRFPMEFGFRWILLDDWATKKRHALNRDREITRTAAFISAEVIYLAIIYRCLFCDSSPWVPKENKYLAWVRDILPKDCNHTQVRTVSLDISFANCRIKRTLSYQYFLISLFIFERCFKIND